MDHLKNLCGCDRKKSNSAARQFPGQPGLLLSLVLIFGLYSFTAEACTPSDSMNNRNRFHEIHLKSDIDSIVVMKRFRQMYVFNNRRLIKVYKVALGDSPIGQKHFQGDMKTPEGRYHICGKNEQSVAHRSLAISYPNEDDRRYAKRFGKPTGGDIMIHGIMNGDENNAAAYDGTDWTWGCIAVSNPEIEELFEHVKIGTPIIIKP